MNYYFTPEPNGKRFKGAKRYTIVTTIQRDIQNTNIKFSQFQTKALNLFQDLEYIRHLANNRKLWRRITVTVTDTVQKNCLKQ